MGRRVFHGKNIVKFPFKYIALYEPTTVNSTVCTIYGVQCTVIYTLILYMLYFEFWGEGPVWDSTGCPQKKKNTIEIDAIAPTLPHRSTFNISTFKCFNS